MWTKGGEGGTNKDIEHDRKNKCTLNEVIVITTAIKTL